MDDSNNQFIEKHKIKELFGDLLVAIVHNKPENPIHFMATYFENYNNKPAEIRAYEIIKLAHYSQPVFAQNLTKAYHYFESMRGTTNDEMGATSEKFSHLLTLLTKQFTPGPRELLLRKIRARDSEFISFLVFKKIVLTCLIMEDYLKVASALFELIDIDRRGEASEKLVRAIIRQLNSANAANKHSMAMKENGEDMPNPQLSPEQLYQSLCKGMRDPMISKYQTVNKEKFLNLTTESFLEQVRPIK